VAETKAIFITGGASGIGRAVAQHFAAKGWFVGLADVNEAGMAETAALLPTAQSSTHKLDVRDRDQWKAALDAFWAVSGRLDVLFNNAGIARGGPFELVSPQDNDLLIEINFKGVLHGAEAGFLYLKKTPSSCLLNTCSASGIYGSPGLVTYSATKFAVRGLTEGLDLEWAPHGIKVRSLMPGFIDTPLLDVTTTGSNRSARDGVNAAGLEFTPVETVAQAAWDAVHGTKVHIPVGPTAKRLALLSRLSPSFLRRMIGRTGGRGRGVFGQ
jgi:NAD(P)-dependent dehydrogenase (short-subunit alcohol dehydrogenase family)